MFAFILTNQWKEYTSLSEINDSDIFPSNSNILPRKDFTHKLEGLSMLCFFWNVFGSLIPLIPTKLTQRGRQEYGAGITNIASPQNEVIRLCLCRTGPVLPPNLGWISFQTVLEWSHWLLLNLSKILNISLNIWSDHIAYHIVVNKLLRCHVDLLVVDQWSVGWQTVA